MSDQTTSETTPNERDPFASARWNGVEYAELEVVDDDKRSARIRLPTKLGDSVGLIFTVALIATGVCAWAKAPTAAYCVIAGCVLAVVLVKKQYELPEPKRATGSTEPYGYT